MTPTPDQLLAKSAAENPASDAETVAEQMMHLIHIRLAEQNRFIPPAELAELTQIVEKALTDSERVQLRILLNKILSNI